MKEPSSALVELVNKMPNPDERGMYCTDIDTRLQAQRQQTSPEIYQDLSLANRRRPAKRGPKVPCPRAAGGRRR